jgi:ERF superfamily protein
MVRRVVDAVTETKPTIVEALTAVKAEVGAVGKGDRNTQQGFMYRGIDAVLKAVAPALINHGVVVAPLACDANHGTVEVGNKRTPMGHCQVTVTYRFYGPGGDHIDVAVPGEAMDSGDKATPKAMSVAYRIALLQALSLPTDEPDPDSQTYERSGHEAGPPAKQVTDHAWLDDIEKRIGEAGSLGELESLSAEVEAKKATGGCEPVHYAHLYEVGGRRHRELSGSSA